MIHVACLNSVNFFLLIELFTIQSQTLNSNIKVLMLIIVALVICLSKILSKNGNVIRVSVHIYITSRLWRIVRDRRPKRFKLLLVITSCLR